MNVHHKIAAWLQEPFFLDSLEILKDLGISTNRYESFLQGGFVPNAIEEEIKIIILQHYDPKKATQPSTLETQNLKNEPVIQEKPSANSQEPSAIQELKNRAKPLHKLQSHLHEQLRHATTDEERYDIAHQMMSEVRPALDAIYNKIRHWEQTKEVPFVLSLEAEKAVEMMKRRESLKPRISRLKGWIKSEKVAESDKAKHRIELEEKEAELAQIKKELNL